MTAYRERMKAGDYDPKPAAPTKRSTTKRTTKRPTTRTSKRTT